MKKEGFREKAVKHYSWELFWKFITVTLIGIFLFIYSLLKIINQGISLTYSLLLILGIIVAIYGFIAVKRAYNHM